MVRQRLPEIDLMRGSIMILMALDHMRDFFDSDALIFSPTDLTRTYPFLFLTRLVTHFCAPGFVFLAGISAYLWGRDQKLRDIFLYLITRGIWLILFDAIIISPVWTLEFGRYSLGALWAIGSSMIALSLLVIFDGRIILTIGLLIVFGHDVFNHIKAVDLGSYAGFWHVVHEQGALPFGLNGKVYYPILPWIGIMALGYGLGPYFYPSAAADKKFMKTLGLLFCILFVVLRTINGYGDPAPWQEQPRAIMSLLSFFNVSKYPPSLLYCLFTLGPLMLLLSASASLPESIAQKIIVFGRVPFLFYFLHLYVGISSAILLAYLQGYDFSNFQQAEIMHSPPKGLGLEGSYLVWICEIILLYPICKWFADLKKRSDSILLRYL